MKKTLALILTLVMLLSCLSVTAFAADFDEGYLGTWTGMLYDYDDRPLKNATLIVEESTCTLTVDGEDNPFTAPYYTDNVFWSDSLYIEVGGFNEDQETGVTTIWANGYYGINNTSFGSSTLTKQTSGNTTITANVAAPEVEYEIVIPQAVTMNEAGVKEIGAATINTAEGKLKYATANTVISYTASGTNFTLKDGDATMAARYYTDSEGKTALTGDAIVVYQNSALVDPLTKLYVGVTQEAWDAAATTAPGTYIASVTYNFSAKEKAAKVTIADILPDEFPVAYSGSDWGNGDDYYLYVSDNNLYAEDINMVSVPVETELTPASGDYDYICTVSGITWSFKTDGKEFIKVNISGAQGGNINANGNYEESKPV